MSESIPSALLSVLERAQKLGFIGKNADLTSEIEHSWLFGQSAFEEQRWDCALSELKCVDLGSGGGLPAVPVALRWPEPSWVFCDISQNKCDFLDWAVKKLDLNASVLPERAEDLSQKHEGTFNVLTSRAFTGNLMQATKLLKSGGRAFVSDPPEGRNWGNLVKFNLTLEKQAKISILRKD